MKIIIVGCGKVGTTLAEQLNRENHDITLIDCDSEALQSISDSTDVMSVTGNGAVYQVQMEAGIKEADLLIATTNSDELNMLCCLIAKKAGNCHTIADGISEAADVAGYGGAEELYQGRTDPFTGH